MDVKAIYVSDGELRQRLGLLSDDQATPAANTEEVAALRRRVEELEQTLQALSETLTLVTLFGSDLMV